MQDRESRVFSFRYMMAGAAVLALAACAAVPDNGPVAVAAVPYVHDVVESPTPGDYRAHVVTIDLTHPGLRFGVTPADNSQGMEFTGRLTSTYLQETGAVLAINANYFLPFKGGSNGGDNYYPHVGQPVNASGAVLSGGRIVSPVETDIDDRVDSMICFEQVRVAIVQGQVCPQGFTDGVASGPHLLQAGQRLAFDPKYDEAYRNQRQPRTSMGISADGSRAFIIVVDGRQAHSAGATMTELQDLFLELGASDAINLDGGGSSTLAAEGADGQPKLLNSPIHTRVPGRERPVANHVLLFKDDAR